MSTEQGRRPVRRALIGVSDKAGLLELATGLHAAGVEIVSTGGTAKVIANAGVPVTPVEQVTGFPESLDGRVKTLHPRVHAGLLADQGNDDHVAQLKKLDIAPFDLLVVNLYPFAQTVASGASPEDCVENIDIGGPAMVRAAAKNHGSVAVVVDPARYDWVLERVAEGGFELADRKRLAAQAYAHTAAYDTAVASWFANSYAPADDSGFPDFTGATWERADVLRYGENPHQKAALYKSAQPGWRTPSSCTARPCRTTTTSTPTPPGAPRSTSPSPPSRSSSTRTRAASPWAWTSPRRTARRTRATRFRPTAA